MTEIIVLPACGQGRCRQHEYPRRFLCVANDLQHLQFGKRIAE
jgi:hypothetical protein